MSPESEPVDLSSDDRDLTETLTNRDNRVNRTVDTKNDVLDENEAVSGGSSMEGEVNSSEDQYEEEDVTMAESDENTSGKFGLFEGGNQAMTENLVEVAVKDDDEGFEGSDNNENSSGDSDRAECKFGVHDLVWGKVRSHPWWPGQILDPSVASTITKKYFKKDAHLIAYFSDMTFAWNAESHIKPFQECFEQMEKQSKSEEFHDAIDCALEEVSRRVEYSLACRCTPKDVYDKIKTQIIDNTGIKEEASKRDDDASFSAVDFFKPSIPVEFIKKLAQQPLSDVSRLEFIAAQAQLLAFYRWKGFSQLPQFERLEGSLETYAGTPLSTETNGEFTENATPALKSSEQVSSEKVKSTREGVSSQKRKKISEIILHHDKKEESLSEIIAKKRHLNSDKLISSSSGKKREMVEQTDDPVAKFMKTELSSESAINSQPKQTFRVGSSILKVASQLNNASPILKSPHAMESSDKERYASVKSPLPGGMLSQLRLSGENPMRKTKSLIPVVNFFSEFRDLICLDPSNSWVDEMHVEQISLDNKEEERLANLEKKEESYIETEKDSICTDKLIQSETIEQALSNNENEVKQFSSETSSVDVVPTPEKEKVVIQLDENSAESASGMDLEADKTPGPMNEDSKSGSVSTALILNFSDLNCIPSERDLNTIFSRYGPIFESKTQVLKKSSRVRVVFKNRVDAETAFSSAGKYSIFGPALVSYRLRYVPVTPVKAPSNSKGRRKKATTPVRVEKNLDM